ncbi:MAG: Ribose ABC transport system, permease protein RbsC, partial [uncultured Thermomicrobiales bacterium]
DGCNPGRVVRRFNPAVYEAARAGRGRSRLWRHCRAGSPRSLQCCIHRAISHDAIAEGESFPGVDHHHCRDGNDARHRDRRDRPLGRVVDGDQWGRRALDLSQRSVAVRYRLVRQLDGARRGNPRRWPVRTLQRRARRRVRHPADHRHTRSVHRRARHRPGHDERSDPDIQESRLSVHWPRSTPWHSLSGHRRRRSRALHCLDRPIDHLRPVSPGDRRKRASGPPGRSASPEDQDHGLCRLRAPGGSGGSRRHLDQFVLRRQSGRPRHGAQCDCRRRRWRHAADRRPRERDWHDDRGPYHPAYPDDTSLSQHPGCRCPGRDRFGHRDCRSDPAGTRNL